MVKKVVGKKPAKKTTKKIVQTKPSGFVGFVRRYKFVIIVLVFVVFFLAIIGGNYVSNKSAISQEKQQFENAEVALNQLQTEIVAKIGEPVSVNSTNACGYASSVDGRGDRGCGVGFELFYESQNIDSQRNKQESIVELLKNSSDFTFVSSDIDSYLETQGPKTKSSDIDFTHIVTQIPCTESSRLEIQSGILRIGASCYSAAISEYYPVKE